MAQGYPIMRWKSLQVAGSAATWPLWPASPYLVQRGKIPAIQIGGRWRIKKSSLDRDILRQDNQGQPTVLVVDDDLGVQDLFRTFLKQTGFSRVVVGTATEAIKKPPEAEIRSPVFGLTIARRSR